MSTSNKYTSWSMSLGTLFVFKPGENNARDQTIPELLNKVVRYLIMPQPIIWYAITMDIYTKGFFA